MPHLDASALDTDPDGMAFLRAAIATPASMFRLTQALTPAWTPGLQSSAPGPLPQMVVHPALASIHITRHEIPTVEMGALRISVCKAAAAH